MTDEAIVWIRDMIVSGELGPGDRIPPEKELSERLGLSRNSLREAVKALDVIGVLDVRRGDGTYVTSLEPRLLLEAMSFVVDLHTDRTVLEMFAVRRMLEPGAAGIAATRMAEPVAEELQLLVDGIDASASTEDLVAHDLRFHQSIVESTGNEYLSRLIESLVSSTVRARLWREITRVGAGERTIAEHRNILAALRNHDSELASALMLAHIAGVEQWLRKAAP